MSSVGKIGGKKYTKDELRSGGWWSKERHVDHGRKIILASYDNSEPHKKYVDERVRRAVKLGGTLW